MEEKNKIISIVLKIKILNVIDRGMMLLELPSPRSDQNISSEMKKILFFDIMKVGERESLLFSYLI